MARPTVWPTRLVSLPSLEVPVLSPLLIPHRDALLLLPHEGNCIRYEGAHLGDYAILTVQGQQQYLHLFWWRLFYLRPPRGVLKRACATPGCVNPLHWLERDPWVGIESKALSDPLGTHIGSDSENHTNNHLLTPPAQPAEGAHASTTNPNNKSSLDNQNISDQYPPSIDSNECSPQIEATLEDELREILIWKWVEEDTPRAYIQIRNSLDLSIWPEPLIIKVLLTIPELAHLTP